MMNDSIGLRAMFSAAVPAEAMIRNFAIALAGSVGVNFEISFEDMNKESILEELFTSIEQQRAELENLIRFGLIPLIAIIKDNQTLTNKSIFNALVRNGSLSLSTIESSFYYHFKVFANLERLKVYDKMFEDVMLLINNRTSHMEAPLSLKDWNVACNNPLHEVYELHELHELHFGYYNLFFPAAAHNDDSIVAQVPLLKQGLLSKTGDICDPFVLITADCVLLVYKCLKILETLKTQNRIDDNGLLDVISSFLQSDHGTFYARSESQGLFLSVISDVMKIDVDGLLPLPYGGWPPSGSIGRDNGV